MIFSNPSRPELGLIQLPTQREPGLSWRQNGRGVKLNTHPHLEPRLNKEYSYTFTPSFWAFVACYRAKFTPNPLQTKRICCI